MAGQEYGIDPERLAAYARRSALPLRMRYRSPLSSAEVIFSGELQGTEDGLTVYGRLHGHACHGDQQPGAAGCAGETGVPAKVLSARAIDPICETITRHKVHELLETGYVVILPVGTGNPYFTTDSAAALRAVEIGADALLKGTRVDGVYTADPEKDPSAVKYETLTFDEAYEKGLKIMDLTAFTLCRENKMPDRGLQHEHQRKPVQVDCGVKKPGTVIS